MKKIYILLALISLAITSINLQSANNITKKTLRAFAASQITNVITPGFQKLSEASNNLNIEVQNQCSNIANFDREQLKVKFKKLLEAYHYTEAFHIGKISRNAGELKEQLYTFPDRNNHKIDRQIADKQKNLTDFKKSYPAMGITAMDYLIYETSLTNKCKSCGVSLLEKWNLLEKEERLQSRCDYLMFVASEFNASASEINKSWTPAGKDVLKSDSFKNDFKFVREFGEQLTVYMNFFDNGVKDKRIGGPSGYIDYLCSTESCPDNSEHIYSKFSILSIEQTLKGLISLLNGTKADDDFNSPSGRGGYKGLLKASGHLEIANEFEKRVKNVLSKLDNTTNIYDLAQGYTHQECINTTSKVRDVEICALYMDIKSMTDYYKNEFINAVELGRPKGGAAEAD